MGRIKSALVKRSSKKMMKEDNAFTDKFEDNKKVLGNKLMPSKRIRNMIAGYLARLKKMQQKEQAELLKTQ